MLCFTPLIVVLTSLGERMSDEDVDELLKGFDTNDGRINYTGLLHRDQDAYFRLCEDDFIKLTSAFFAIEAVFVSVFKSDFST